MTARKAHPPAQTDPSGFKWVASIDTVLIEIKLCRSCVKSKLKSVIAGTLGIDIKSVYAEPTGSEPSSRWRIQVENPTTARLGALQEALQASWGVDSSPEVVWLDLAVDARLRGVSASCNVVSAYAPLMRQLRDCFNPCRATDAGPLWAQWRYRGAVPMSQEELDAERFPGNLTAYIGDLPNGADARFCRVYWKTSDSGGSGMRQALCQSARCARFERRFARVDLARVGLLWVDDLRGFSFRKLRPWFTFADAPSLVPIAEHRRSIQNCGLDIRAHAKLNRAFGDALASLRF